MCYASFRCFRSVCIGAIFSFAPLALAQEKVDFSHEVVPLLRKHCAECHTGAQKKGGFSIDTRETLLEGGESGAAVVVGKPSESRLMELVTSKDEGERMPPEGPGLEASEVATLERWIATGMEWEPGFAFTRPAYEPPLKPRRPEVPAGVAGRTHVIDRFLDHYLQERQLNPPMLCDDTTFARRSSLDLVGLLPDPKLLQAFVDDRDPAKREKWIQRLLADDVAYAEHWLTFWNDLLRNDYGGTGFITNGRKQISRWLYSALVENKPFDDFTRELISPANDSSRGYIDGIRWRGEVSAGQTVEIQFAQSVGQSFLGINMKCASCHDSFTDRWKLDEAYGLAAIYASQPLTIHRCDKPIDRVATPSWLFPELGQIDAAAPQPERLKQLADLMTHPENGRFTRTIVNRLWHRLMGRGLVHPLDAMQTEPWNSDVLDYLGVYLADHDYDLKQVLALIATSHAYQSVTEVVDEGIENGSYVYYGPRAKRLSAEQFVDCVWQLTGAAPTRFDAPVVRGKADREEAAADPLTANWIWGASADPGPSPAGETIRFYQEFELADKPLAAAVVMTCDNAYQLFINGNEVGQDSEWKSVETISIVKQLKKGKNTIDVVAKNAGDSPNLAGLYLEARVQITGEESLVLKSNEQWRWTATVGAIEKKKIAPVDESMLAPVVLVKPIPEWQAAVDAVGSAELLQILSGNQWMVRASLLKSDFLTRSLGRPNRDQIVSMRPIDLSTLEAIDLANGETLANWLRQGAANRVAEGLTETDQASRWVFTFGLGRSPTSEESEALTMAFGPELDAQEWEDLLWTVVVLPEFQIVR